MDARQYLLRQRRNRIYGCGDLDEGQDAALFSQQMPTSIEHMASDVVFPFDSIFDRTLPKCALHGNALDQVNAALEASISKGESQNLFVDTSTSSKRNPEAAEGVTTCIRPSHAIYSTELQRYVTAQEMFLCQGLFAQDFENPRAVQHLLETDPKQAQDLAGNAFASTCAQVQLLASLIHAKGWSHIGINDILTTGSSPEHLLRDQCRMMQLTKVTMTNQNHLHLLLRRGLPVCPPTSHLHLREHDLKQRQQPKHTRQVSPCSRYCF